MRINLPKFHKLIDSHLISVQKHPTADLYIYNYTEKAQYDRVWTNETLMARGLITDGKGNIKARPFSKFFNYEEHVGEDSKLPELPVENFEVYDKLDGSLGIMYFIDGKPYIATRGSFVSDQAIKGTQMLEKYDFEWEEGKTYLMEIIYPENRIVVDYGGLEELVVLAVFDTDTGMEYARTWLEAHLKGKVPLVDKFHGVDDIKKLTKAFKDNKEGFVIRFKSGIRTKVKFEEYKRLHRILTGVNARSIWEILKDGGDMQDLCKAVPDEFYNWVQKASRELKKRYRDIEKDAMEKMLAITMELEFLLGDGTGNIIHWDEYRKLFAQRANKTKIAGILFKILDGKPYSDLIWKMIKPEAGKAFNQDIDSI